MNLPVTKIATKMPAIFAQTATGDEQNEFTANVQSGFPVISFRGKVWRIRKSGKEENYLSEEGDAMPSIEIVMVRSNPKPSKIFYSGTYEEGSGDAPDCWASNGETPDADVPAPVSKTCAACPNNVWGSKMTPSGAKSRACADVRRVAVVFTSDLEAKGHDATPFLLRIPPASLNPLKDYAVGLQSRGMYPYAMVTKVGFDTTTAHPKLTFRPVRILSDEEAEVIVRLRSEDTVHRILAEATEFVAAGITSDEGEAGGAPPVSQSKAPAAASKPAGRKLQPVEEEDDGEEEVVVVERPSPPPPRKKAAAPAPVAAPVEEEGEEEAEEPAAPPPRKKAAPVAPTASAGGKSVDYDAMLDSIIGPKKK